MKFLQTSRMKWVDDLLDMCVFIDDSCLLNDETAINLRKELQQADVLLIGAVTRQELVQWIEENSKNTLNLVCFDSSPKLTNKLGGSLIRTEHSNGSILPNMFQSKETTESAEVVRTVSEAWTRHNSYDIRFYLLVIINAYVRSVPILKNLRSKGFSILNCMVKNCGPQILNFLLEPNCRKALQCLNQCSPVDQVCNYRCIASYENPYLEAFSLCVLQKNNCLELDAEIPQKPYVPPMVSFRGQNMTHDIAEDLFVGWLGNLVRSWRVRTLLTTNTRVSTSCSTWERQKGRSGMSTYFRLKPLKDKLCGGGVSTGLNGARSPEHLTSLFWTMGLSRRSSGQLWMSPMTLAGVCSITAGLLGQAITGAVLVSPDG